MWRRIFPSTIVLNNPPWGLSLPVGPHRRMSFAFVSTSPLCFEWSPHYKASWHWILSQCCEAPALNPCSKASRYSFLAALQTNLHTWLFEPFRVAELAEWVSEHENQECNSVFYDFKSWNSSQSRRHKHCSNWLPWSHPLAGRNLVAPRVFTKSSHSGHLRGVRMSLLVVIVRRKD